MAENAKLAENPNVNCLESRRCPQCSSFGPFEVSISAWVLVHDDGTDYAEHGSVEFDEESLAKCPGCGYSGKFGDFDESRR